MKFKRTMKYKVRFLENKRCRKEMETFVSKEVELEVPEISEAEFPVAFIVHDHATIHDGAESYKDFKETNCMGYQLYEEEIRVYEGTLYKPVRVSYGTALSTVFQKDPNEVIFFPDTGFCLDQDIRYTSESVLLASFGKEKYAQLQEICEQYKAFDGKIWEKTGEPYYWITEECMLIQYGTFNDYQLPSNHFSALEREDVLPLIKNEASRESYIEVKIPEMVKLYRPKYFNVTICCQAYYNSQIKLPRGFSGSYEDAIAYSKKHLDEAPLGKLEYISASDVLDEENCSFD